MIPICNLKPENQKTPTQYTPFYGVGHTNVCLWVHENTGAHFLYVVPVYKKGKAPGEGGSGGTGIGDPL